MLDKPKDCEARLDPSGYAITLIHLPTKDSVTITLTPDQTRGHKHKQLKWRVDAKGFMGKYLSLDSAWGEAVKQLKVNLGSGGAMG